MSRETCQLLTREIMHTGRIPTGNSYGRPAILPEKQILPFLRVWQTASREPYRTIARHYCFFKCPRELTLGRETKTDIPWEWNTKFLIIPEIRSKRVHSKLLPEFLLFHSILDLKSRNFRSNGKRPKSHNDPGLFINNRQFSISVI